MKNRKCGRNISLVVFPATALQYFLYIVPVVSLFYLDASVFCIFNVFISILLARFIVSIVWKSISEWIEWIIYTECDYESYRLSQEKTIKMKRNRNNVKSHLSLFNTYLVLGRYDECQKEINELDRLSSRMSDMQTILYGFHKADYLLETANSYPDVIKEINQIAETLDKSEKISQDEKNVIQKGIMTHTYLAEEKWEEVIALLKNEDNETIYEKVKNSFRLGKCYYLIGEYEQAFSKLLYVRERGGNTKFVALANDMIKSIPQSETYEGLEQIEKSEKIKTGHWKIYADLLAFCLILFTTIFINYYSLHGTDLKEIYCKRYLCKGNEVSILYQQSYGNYEMLILNDSGKEKVAYCLFEKISEISTPKYRMADSFFTNMYLDNHKEELEMIDKLSSEGEKESSHNFFQESIIKQELWSVINGFYKKNRYFRQEDLEYVGISSSRMVENVTVNGNPVGIEQINDVNDLPVYLWRLENVDLNTDIQVEYAEQ